MRKPLTLNREVPEKKKKHKLHARYTFPVRLPVFEITKWERRRRRYNDALTFPNLPPIILVQNVSALIHISGITLDTGAETHLSLYAIWPFISVRL